MRLACRFLLAMFLGISALTAQAGLVNPDSEKGLTLEFEFKKLPAFVPVLMTPLHEDAPIKNANGDQVVKGAVASIVGKAIIRTKVLVNDLKVTGIINVHGKAGQPLDPGFAYESVFDASNIMSSDPLTTWLDANGYGEPGGITVPDFLAVSLDEIYYGVNFATLLNNGESFSNTYSVGQQFSIDASGEHIGALPQYVFSATPLSYVPGVGWTGTPLPEGTLIEYTNDHIVRSAVPEPSCLALFAMGAIGLVAARRVRNRPARLV